MARLTTRIQTAAACLRAGKLCAFPTETVYGLGALASCERAVQDVFALKRRPAGHPLIVHVSSFTQFAAWAQPVPELAKQLAAQFLPGPLTMLLPRIKDRGELAAGGLDTVALRVPAHPLAQKLLAELGDALVAPSANLFGRPSPTEAAHVLREFPAANLLVLDGGPTTLGIESTIIDLTEPDRPCIARLGSVTAADLAAACGTELALRSPRRTAGSCAAHYAPRQPLRVLATQDFAAAVASYPEHTVAALGFTRPAGIVPTRWRRMPAQPQAAARVLYRNLLALEDTAATLIVIEQVPKEPGWLAIADRLQRAAAARS